MVEKKDYPNRINIEKVTGETIHRFGRFIHRRFLAEGWKRIITTSVRAGGLLSSKVTQGVRTVGTAFNPPDREGLPSLTVVNIREESAEGNMWVQYCLVGDKDRQNDLHRTRLLWKEEPQQQEFDHVPRARKRFPFIPAPEGTPIGEFGPSEIYEHEIIEVQKAISSDLKSQKAA
ncbi:hypothetical protein HYT33_03160 [Candidatus Roizmanbacteria bacterium]|nr:hypothetical protein [Candidatus Roizmanbacteria bacterium]